MNWATRAVILFCGIYISEAGYGIRQPPPHDNPQSDVQAPSYAPPYARTRYSKTYSSSKTYSGAKNGYGGTKTGYGGTKTGYGGTKTGYGGTKNGYTGTKTSYGTKQTWHSDTGSAPTYEEFSKNANQVYQAKCEPDCKNNGICVDTNTCHCPPNYKGAFCEIEAKPCLAYPPLPMNSLRKCSTDFCTISCFEGYKFAGLGTTVANMKCGVDGTWQPTTPLLASIPDCEPQCSPACLNGGVCLAVDTCQCPAEYRGPQCQYSTSACDVRKLAFNGGYNCHGDADSFSCSLNCPAGVSFSSPPADQYTCTYATGQFLPQPIPHCVFSDNMIVIPGEHKNSSYYKYHHTKIHGSGSEQQTSGFEQQNSGFEQQTGFEQELGGFEQQVGGFEQQVGGFEQQVGGFEQQVGGFEQQVGGFEQENSGFEQHRGFSVDAGFTKRPMSIVVQDFTPKGGVCLTWAGVHYKTFDGKIYSFQSPCQHVLLRERKEHKYTVALQYGDCQKKAYCPPEMSIYLEDRLYTLSVQEDGTVAFRNTKRLIPIPASLEGIRVSMPSDYVIVNLDSNGVTIKWDTNTLIVVEGTAQLWNNTEGLCGTLNSNPRDEFLTKEGQIAPTQTAFTSSWQVNKIGDVCTSNPSETNACASKTELQLKQAKLFCSTVFSKDKFRKCSKVMDVTQLLETCQWDYCACAESLSPEECACATVAVYAKECLRNGVDDMRHWRDSETCPMKCPEGRIYKACGPDAQPSCAFPSIPTQVDNATCVEGCFCPEGTLLEGGRCIPKSECPCRLRNKSFKPGSVVNKDCNTCACQAGEWTCTEAPCGARCSAMGDPHYMTFDGTRYDFMGHCTYDLMKTDNVTVEAENVACSGAITEAMNLTPYKGSGKPSCTKAVNIKYNNANIHLKQGGYILVNGQEVSSLPAMVNDIKIRAASSLFIIVQLPNKVDVWWDGSTRVFVDVPAGFVGKTKGLCGTFNLNQKDDFLTPEGDVEQSVYAFANKWKTREFCEDVDVKEPEHPCKANVGNKETAEKYCSKLKSKLFEPCHWYVDVEPYYESCVYDMCACADDAARCLCPILGDYGMACAKQGVPIQWRYNVRECELSCSGGQEYTVCADSCLRTCTDVAQQVTGECRPTCVEGCACKPGQVLNENSMCVPTGMCPCYHKGMKFDSGYKEVRAGRRERELCTCVGARWECTPATSNDIQNYPPAEDMKSNCSAANHMEFTTCEIGEPLTCKNMHLPPLQSSGECRPGCQCKKGYVLETVSNKCVLSAQCPCHHGGRSYPDGHVMQEECNKCECKSGNWSCTTRKCAGTCSAWGDSHVSTFDGSEYDFEGVCTYLLAKGVLDGKDGFDVEIQNVPCGTTGATCSKSITLKVGSGNNEEIASLTKDAHLPDLSKLKRIKLRVVGAYVFLDVPSLGMSVQWDRGLRVYVRVDAMWQGRLKGLCGNYNADMRDDFQTPGGGIAESSALIFVDSWKLKSTCPKAQAVRDHCRQRPERKDWATTYCGALKRYPFTLCHTEVAVSAYIARCETDACACDAGDDCACACAALAQYAHVCAGRGVAFKWRTQELCPMQCDEECSNYDECLSSCPLETCDNTLDYPEIKAVCEQDTCVEGCKPKKSCPDGEVYTNSTFTECVPRSKCRHVCMTLPDGKVVLEGQITEEDACHTCRCSKKHIVCTGQPCSSVAPLIMTTEPSSLGSPRPHDEPLKCVPGWSPWVNRGPPQTGPHGESEDIEPLPKLKELQIGKPMCPIDKMTDIECRTTVNHKSAKETGLNVECSLERGLVCKEKGNLCPDFEIRVYCQCEESTTSKQIIQEENNELPVTVEEPFQCLNADHPNYPHPTDCSMFYECTPDDLNPTLKHAVLKNCGAGLMYNPKLMVCDWPASVMAVRPECGAPSTTTPTPLTTPSRCPPGYSYSDCNPCNQLCHHFKHVLQDRGRCLGTEKCVEGCVPEKCTGGKVWRDEHTCVPVKDCTCYYDGKLIKPDGVVSEGCKKCQCLYNDLHCDTSECASPSPSPSPPPPTPPPTTARATTTTTTTTPSRASTPLIVKDTQTPPPQCEPDRCYLRLRNGECPTPTRRATSGLLHRAPAAHLESTRHRRQQLQPPPSGNLPLAIICPVCPVGRLVIETRYKNLLWEDEPLPASAFAASSVANALFEPQYAQLDAHPIDTNAGSWSPAVEDQNQYIQVTLPRREPIYGVVMQGSPLFDQYVTSYELMYGDDGQTFSVLEDSNGKPKVLRGPLDHNNPAKAWLSPPIEAKVVRIRPLSWHDSISVRFQLIGCGDHTTTAGLSYTTPSPIQCDEPLGLAAQLPLDSIEVSSNSDLKKHFKLDGERGWKPLYSTPGEWIMFDFTAPRNITGVKTKGGPTGWVTAYNILYSNDLTTFNPVVDDTGAYRVFPGNYDKDSEVFNEFRPPIHARYLKLLPLKWKDAIEMRVEPIGCFEPYPVPQCDEPLGLAAELPLESIEVSSNNELRPHFKLDGGRGWKPTFDAPGEWIMFDFTAPRNITGVKTKGGPTGWVTAYNILYSNDLTTFNPVVDDTGAYRVFPGNYDKDSVKFNEFRPPIHARYLKLLPLKWKDAIEMRVEPIGCFEPYPVTQIIPDETTPASQAVCELCPGVQSAAQCACTAPGRHYFDGEECVSRDQCPCVEGLLPYAVGSTFRGENCTKCVCKLGGITDCKPVKECECAPDLVPKLVKSTCECTCKPCPEGTRICPTSKTCLELSKWCNGLQDCPDDERNCKVKEPIVVTTEATVGTTRAVTLGAIATTVPPTTEAAKPTQCPEVTCPPGYFVRYVTTSSYSKTSSDLPPPRPRNSYSRYRKGGYTKGGYTKGGYSKTGFSKTGYSKGGYSKGGITPPPLPTTTFPPTTLPPTTHKPNSSQECRQFKCVPNLPLPYKPGATPPPLVCSTPVCPPHYTLKLDTQPSQPNQCPQYICVPPPEQYAYCNMTGRTFNTFDGAEYKFDVCFHILARDAKFNAWSVLVRKMCGVDGCVNHLILQQDEDVILIKPNLMIQYNQYEYTVEQTSKICFQKNSFDVNQIGNGLVIKSRRYDFSVLYSTDGNVKVAVNTKYKGFVDGLCGYFDGDVSNERRKPDGSYSTSIDEFAQGWAKPGLRADSCEIKLIPPEKQKRAWQLCDVITKEPINQCASVLNLDKWRSMCLEKVCECMDLVVNGTRKSDEECRCQFLDTVIAQCLAADSNVDLGDWRMQMDCPADCPPPFVRYDCYRRQCEPTCPTVGSAPRSCPLVGGQCFPGCYCPDGKLRKGDTCVTPPDCLDCACSGVGTPAKYVSFEGDDLPALGNCTYLASRDTNQTGHHDYEVYASNGPCETNPKTVCTKAVHLVYNKNIVHVTKDGATNKLITTINDKPVFSTLSNDWITVLLTGQDVTLSLPDAHVEVKVFQAKMEFSVKVPSYIYANRTEGLCGVCAGYQEHLITSNGTATDDFDEYGKSWQASPSTLEQLNIPPQEQCGDIPPPPECKLPPADQNPCNNLLNADKFGQCHALLDPQPYVDSCEEELCTQNSTDICSVLERYAAECRRQRVCLDWRDGLCPYPCEAPFVYESCNTCEYTCENKEAACNQIPVEGCFCPHGKVRVNNTCIEPNKCFPCDANKEHFAGDEWQEDACTKCTCSKLSSENTAHVSCTTQSCAAPVCTHTEHLVTKPAKPGACCPEYMCVPTPHQAQCEEPKRMECGYGQVLKQKTSADGCTQFACECKPASECEHIPSLNEIDILEPGMERVIDESGCCPRALLLCRPHLCPPAPDCPKYHELRQDNSTGKCCPKYECEAPKDKCIVSLEWEATPKGGEKQKEKPVVTLKDVEAVWVDGPCRWCRCERSPLGPSVRCATTECAPIVATDLFVLEPKPVPFACCPEAVYVACRDGDNIYKVGENWTNPDNVCESYQCVQTDDGKLDKVTTVQNCHTDCEVGWQYFPAEAGSGKCCGRCKPVACVCEGVEHNIGERWSSPDFCTHYTCVDTNGTIQVQSSNDSCPEVSVQMKKQFVLKEDVVPGKCCKTQEPVACRVADKIYQEGQTWPSPDPCKNYTCARDLAGRLTHKESTETCVKECTRGWVYKEPKPDVCCGQCEPSACVVDDQLKPPGTTWYSADNCTTYSCERDGDSVVVSVARQTCPDVSACDPEDIVNETCCRVCREKPPALSTCVPTSLGLESVGIIRVQLHGRGLCINTKPVPAFRECRGTCDSGTIYNNQTGSHDSKCECCQATKYSPVTVELSCADGSKQQHKVASPTKCSCNKCGGDTVPPWAEKTTWATESPDEIPEIYMRFGSSKAPRRHRSLRYL